MEKRMQDEKAEREKRKATTKRENRKNVAVRESDIEEEGP
jgi:hypothetical protein